VRRFILALLAAALGGCLNPPSERDAPRYFVLEAAGNTPRAEAPRRATLLVAPTTAAAFYDTPQIVYSRERGTRGYYQVNRWTERPNRAIHGLLIQRLRESGAFARVAEPGSGLRADLALRTHVEEMYHDAVSRPGTVHVVLVATLEDAAKREVIARQEFRRSAAAASYDARGAVSAFDQAVGEVLNDVVGWVQLQSRREAMRAPSPSAASFAHATLTGISVLPAVD